MESSYSKYFVFNIQIFTCISQHLYTSQISYYNYQKLIETLIFKATEGDFAICYYDYLNQILVLTRDMFGKRSLLLQFDEMSNVAVMSASVYPQKYEIFELPSNAVFFIATSETTGIPINGVGQMFQFAVNYSFNDYVRHRFTL
jgi:hypothetical protein